MPATSTRNTRAPFVLGLDGARAGWVAVRLNLDDGSPSVAILDHFGAVITRERPQMLIVDMPIGLADQGRRACEGMARGKLKPLRHSSVFSSPRRPMLGFDDYASANAWGKAQTRSNGENTGSGKVGGGLSKQAWMIAPKIREVDRIVTPADQSWIGEGHPELAFWRLNGGVPCAFPKRKSQGADERRRLLIKAGIANPDTLYEQACAIAGRLEKGAGVARDDVYDACVMALTAKARLEGNAVRLSDNAKDARGLVMEIWG